MLFGGEGRCKGQPNARQRVASELSVLFPSGSLQLGNRVAYLDLDTLSWGRPLVIGGRHSLPANSSMCMSSSLPPPPSGAPPWKRMSAVMALAGSSKLLVYGGWIYSEGEVRHASEPGNRRPANP